MFIGTNVNSRGKVEPFNLRCICRTRSREELAQHLCFFCAKEKVRRVWNIYGCLSPKTEAIDVENLCCQLFIVVLCARTYTMTISILDMEFRQCPKCTALIRVCDSLECLKHHEICESILQYCICRES